MNPESNPEHASLPVPPLSLAGVTPEGGVKGQMSREEGKVHALKTWPPFYEAVEKGWKTFELRKGDRLFNVGDTLRLEEWCPVTKEYTGRSCERIITYTLTGFGLERGWVALGIALPFGQRAEGEG